MGTPRPVPSSLLPLPPLAVFSAWVVSPVTDCVANVSTSKSPRCLLAVRHAARSIGADEVVKRPTFETGSYSRCWEIRSAHITEDAANCLSEFADIATPTGFMFVAFRLPYSPAIGVKLTATPRTDDNLQHVEGITAAQLRQEHLDHGMPGHLVEILHLAAQADVRILIFDAEAPVLDDLPVYEQHDTGEVQNDQS